MAMSYADPVQAQRFILAIVVGIVLIIVGAVTGTVAYAIGDYVLQQLNHTEGVTISPQANFLATVTNVISPAFTILGVVVIVIAAVGIIRLLFSTVADFQTMAGMVTG